MEKNVTKEDILEFTRSQGADVCGVADLTVAEDFVRATYGDFFAGFPRAVSFALFFPKEVVNEQLEGPTRNYETIYLMLNREIERISRAVAIKLQRAGFRAYPLDATDYRPKAHEKRLHYIVAAAEDVNKLPKIGFDIIDVFSHRLAAAHAGLGWIGKSCSLINPEVGPRLRLGTVLTDAPFEPDSPIENRCGSCHSCIDACPTRALHGRGFDPADPLSARFDVQKCYEFFDKVETVYGIGICGLCLASCPWGK